MDNVTHALAGAVLAAAACHVVARRRGEVSASFRGTAFTIGVVTAELPDIDVMYSGDSLGMGKLGYLLHHRGHTHTVLFALASAVVVWALALALRRGLRAPGLEAPLLVLALAGTLSHVALDFTNSYGVHPFWPVVNRWFYGDAVFIVEPWLWIVSLPPLFFIARGRAWRAACALLLAAILVAAWRVDVVERSVAVVLVLGAVLWTMLSRAVPAARRVALALGGWLVVEGIFFAASGVARRAVRREVGPSLRDVVLSSAPGNPFCLSAIVVEETEGRYVATTATVASVPAWRAVATCGLGIPAPAASVASGRPDSRRLRWGASWSAPVLELRQLAAANCEASAALRFMRVPIWRRAAEGAVTLFDLRYGEGAGSFTSVVVYDDAPCPRLVPDWEWPRSDLLGNAARSAARGRAGSVATR